MDLTPPVDLFSPVADRDNATISFQLQSGVTIDANGFPVIASTTQTVRARCFNSPRVKTTDYFPDGLNLEGELIEGRLNSPTVFPDGLEDLTTVQVTFDDGRTGSARISIKTQNPLLGAASQSVLGQRFALLFRKEN